MSRQLKFRVWDKLAERFTRCDEGYQGHYVLSLKGEFYNLQNGSGGKEYIVQQWTGLKDKNGVEIYEGDIVNHWIDIGPGGEKQITSQIAIGEWGPNLQSWTYMEKLLPDIIGNIFENPELLK